MKKILAILLAAGILGMIVGCSTKPAQSVKEMQLEAFTKRFDQLVADSDKVNLEKDSPWEEKEVSGGVTFFSRFLDGKEITVNIQENEDGTVKSMAMVTKAENMDKLRTYFILLMKAYDFDVLPDQTTTPEDLLKKLGAYDKKVYSKDCENTEQNGNVAYKLCGFHEEEKRMVSLQCSPVG